MKPSSNLMTVINTNQASTWFLPQLLFSTFSMLRIKLIVWLLFHDEIFSFHRPRVDRMYLAIRKHRFLIRWFLPPQPQNLKLTRMVTTFRNHYWCFLRERLQYRKPSIQISCVCQAFHVPLNSGRIIQKSHWWKRADWIRANIL